MLTAGWGCPAAGRTPPPALPDTVALPLARTAAHVARVAGLSEPPCSCPFAPLERAAPFTLRVLRAVSRAADPLRLPLASSLPGGVTAADDAALDAFLIAHHRAAESDEEDRERERARKTTP